MRCSSVSASGTQSSDAIGAHDATEAVAGITPMIVWGSSLSLIVWPITFGSLPSSVFQNRSLRMTTAVLPRVFSSGRKARPSVGRARTMSKKPSPTTPASTPRAVPLPDSA